MCNALLLANHGPKWSFSFAGNPNFVQFSLECPEFLHVFPSFPIYTSSGPTVWNAFSFSSPVNYCKPRISYSMGEIRHGMMDINRAEVFGMLNVQSANSIEFILWFKVKARHCSQSQTLLSVFIRSDWLKSIFFYHYSDIFFIGCICWHSMWTVLVFSWS